MTITLALSYDDAATAVGLSSAKLIRQAVRDGFLVPTYLNSKPVIQVTELTRWLETQPSERPT